MKLCIYSDQASAQALSDAVDVAMGYPMPPTFVGDGVPDDPMYGWTLHASFVIKHPTQAKWGYAVDTVPGDTLAQVGAVSPTTVVQDEWMPPLAPVSPRAVT